MRKWRKVPSEELLRRFRSELSGGFDGDGHQAVALDVEKLTPVPGPNWRVLRVASDFNNSHRVGAFFYDGSDDVTTSGGDVTYAHRKVGADFDLRMLYRLGLGAPARIFDTMIAARLTGAAKYGYAALVAEHFGVVLPKGQQKANWGRRPLAPVLAEYARNDTHFLLPLSERLERRLAELGRLTWLEQSCQRAVAAARIVRERDPHTEWRVKGSHTLGPRASAVLRGLWQWRESEARTIDRPPFHVMSNEDLVNAARRVDQGESVSPRGVRRDRRARFARAAEEALTLDPGEWPHRAPVRTRTRLTRDQDRHVAALRQQRDQAAKTLAIDADLIAPRAALERIATEGDDGLDALLPWQQSLLRRRD